MIHHYFSKCAQKICRTCSDLFAAESTIPLRWVPVSILVIAVLAGSGFSEIYNGETSNRVKINMGETPWKFIRANQTGSQNVDYNDANWKTIGIPHTWNDTDTYINEQSGGGDGSMYGGVCWYRKYFTVDNQYQGRKIFIEFEGANIGAAVYLNGTFIPGNSGANPNCTHVNGFLPFVVDITDDVLFGQENVLAVAVSNGGYIYQESGFSTIFRFGMHDGGLTQPVWMHITDPVYVPLNVYSVVENWGTYVKTVSASEATANVQINTNVQNDGGSSATVTLITRVVDAGYNVVLQMEDSHAINAGQAYEFEQDGDISNPHLWYPACTENGGPYMYKVYHTVQVGGETVDVFESPLGIRVITWDEDYPYINGQQFYLWGASGRYDYPALGSAMPEEQIWRDIKLTADVCGRLWRPGHASERKQWVDACDHYGVMLIQPSGDGEGTWNSPSATQTLLKKEYHRDMIIRDRNHPCILAWEVSNAGINSGLASELKSLSVTWDPIHTAAQAERGADAGNGDIHGCTLTGCEIGVKNSIPNEPAWGSEAWGRHSSRFAYDYELQFAGEFVQNWRRSIEHNCFGLVQWYLVETPGEVGDFLEGGPRARSFGSSMMDHNRIPKLLYHIYDVCWTPYELKPEIALAHHWNRSGSVRVNAFSNCPQVRLRVNGADQGVKTPNPWNGTGTGNDQNTTQLPYQCWWDNVTWEAGTLRAEGLDASGNVVCFVEKKTAGAPHHIELTVEPPLVKPNGEQFNILANGSDCAFILATVVDADGNWCPTASNTITFAVSGPGNYRGGTEQFVTDGQPKTYHAPLDPELNADGGMTKVAVKSTFEPGDVTVTATSSGLGSGEVTYTVHPLSDGPVTLIGQKSFAPRSSILATEIRIVGNKIRYYISEPSNAVSIRIFDAGGRELRRISQSRQDKGWHQISLNRRSDSRDNLGNGIYFARLEVDGKYQCAKQIVLIQ